MKNKTPFGHLFRVGRRVKVSSYGTKRQIQAGTWRGKPIPKTGRVIRLGPIYSLIKVLPDGRKTANWYYYRFWTDAEGGN